jgi:hypothetical protein
LIEVKAIRVERAVIWAMEVNLRSPAGENVQIARRLRDAARNSGSRGGDPR